MEREKLAVNEKKKAKLMIFGKKKGTNEYDKMGFGVYVRGSLDKTQREA